MTPYGRYLYSIGKFKPHSYEFVDDDIVRIRLPDKKRDVGSQGGFRVTVWKAIDIEEKNYF